MSTVKKIISMHLEDVEYLEQNSISLSKFVRNNVKKLKETEPVLSTESVSQEPIGKEDSNIG